MFIRYQHVRNAVILAAAVGLGVLGWRQCTAHRPSDIEPGPVTPVARKAPPVREVPPASQPASMPAAAAVMPRYVSAMRVASAMAAGPKVKDALGRGDPWKLNLYDDDGDGRWDRAKLDLDRDGSWDEKWTFKAGRWEREGGVSVWDGARWIRATQPRSPEQPPAAKQPPASTAPVPDRLLDLARVMLEGKAEGKKVKDLYQGQGLKANLYDDDGDGRWDRAKLDLDRDGKWDEKWTRKEGGLERKMEGGKILRHQAGGWVEK